MEAGAHARDVAVLVRSNAAADPVLRSLNLEGIPWRFSGTSGLYARPEVKLLLAFLRTLADPNSSVDVYALATHLGPLRVGRRGPPGDRPDGAAPEHGASWRCSRSWAGSPGIT
ncbi:MAG: 3'-5' exonuclease [Chloroflexota bacterium]